MKDVFGALKVKTSHKGELFSIRKNRGGFTYTRGNKKIKVLGDSLELEVLPLAPVHLPEKITDFFSVNFPKLHVSPRGRAVVFLKVPLEIGVFLGGELIDVIGFAKEEFSLYGPVDGGIIVRQLEGEEVSEKERGDGKSLVIPLRIKNYTNEVKKVSRVILDSRFFDIYYKGKKVVTEMVKLDLMEVPRVRYLNKNYFGKMNKKRAKRQILKKEDVTEMRWGT